MDIKKGFKQSSELKFEMINVVPLDGYMSIIRNAVNLYKDFIKFIRRHFKVLQWFKSSYNNLKDKQFKQGVIKWDGFAWLTGPVSSTL